MKKSGPIKQFQALLHFLLVSYIGQVIYRCMINAVKSCLDQETKLS